MANSILFLVDHKYRDLKALSLIGFFLKKKNWQVFFLPLDVKDEKIDKINPNIVVLPKPTFDTLRVIRWSKLNRKIVIIESEGNPQDLKYKARILIPIDYYIFWNKLIKDRYNKLLTCRNIYSEVIGFYRSDFLHNSLKSLNRSKAEVLASIGLNNNNKIVTIATSSQDSHFSKKRLKEKKKKRNRNLSETASYDLIVTNMLTLRNLCVDFIKEFSFKNPGINIVIKPHPHENVVFWHELIEKISLPNVKIFLGNSINELLNISDFHIAYNVCTTTAEASISGLATMELNTVLSEKLYDLEHLSLPKYRATEVNEMSDYILSEFLKKNSKDIDIPYKKRVDNYISKYFHIFDGKRCAAYAYSIDKYYLDSKEKRITKSKFPTYLKLITLFISLKRLMINIFFKKKIISNFEIIKQVNRPSERNQRKIKKIGSKIVDYEYGLFDNRIKPEDAQYWIYKFEDFFVK